MTSEPISNRCAIAKEHDAGKNEQRRSAGTRRRLRGPPLSNEEEAMLHLVMAACWLIFGGLLLAWQWSDLAVPTTYIWGTGIPLGWFGIAMALYNLLRWWMDLKRPIRKVNG